MLQGFMLIVFAMLGYSARCSLLDRRKSNERFDLLEAKLELEKRYRHEEFDYIIAKLNNIEEKLSTVLSQTALEDSASCSHEDDFPASEVEHKRDNDITILKTAFKNEKEHNKKIRQESKQLEQAVSNIVGIISELKEDMDSISMTGKESLKELTTMSVSVEHCDIWRNEVGEMVSMIDMKMNETITMNKLSLEMYTNYLNDHLTNNSEDTSLLCKEYNGKNGSNLDKVKETKLYSSCQELLKNGFKKSGSYAIYPNDEIGKIQVYCEQEIDGGGWTVFQRRQDGSVNFYRNWTDYKRGFGNINAEFWLGNDILSTLTRNDSELRIDLGDFEGNQAYARYDNFSVGREDSGYKLGVGKFSGSAGDSLSYHNGMKFSTTDRDNDEWSPGKSCVEKFKGCWWYKGCYNSNLNGIYHNSEEDKDLDGLVWYGWKGFHKSLKYVQMMLR